MTAAGKTYEEIAQMVAEQVRSAIIRNLVFPLPVLNNIFHLFPLRKGLSFLKGLRVPFLRLSQLHCFVLTLSITIISRNV